MWSCRNQLDSDNRVLRLRNHFSLSESGKLVVWRGSPDQPAGILARVATRIPPPGQSPYPVRSECEEMMLMAIWDKEQMKNLQYL